MTSTVKDIAKRPKLIARKVRRQRRQRQRRNQIKVNPISISSTFQQGKYKYHKFAENEQIIEGVDLFSLRYDYETTLEGLQPFCVIPLNPLYWDGTRIKTLASTWSRYQPLMFEVTYTPTVATTTPGQVIYGTFPPNPNFSRTDQFLISSNGGGLTTIYTVAKSYVDCSLNALGQKSFELNGDMSNPSCCPLQWVINHVVTPNIRLIGAPGYITVHWKYRFTNPATGTPNNATTLISDPAPPQLRRAIPWGLVISALKDTAIRILRRVVVVILEETIVTIRQASGLGAPQYNDRTTIIPQFQSFVYEISDDPICVITNGEESYEVPPETPVIAYMSGDEVKRSGPDIEDAWQFVTAKAVTQPWVEPLLFHLVDTSSVNPTIDITWSNPSSKNAAQTVSLTFYGDIKNTTSVVKIDARAQGVIGGKVDMIIVNPRNGMEIITISDSETYTFSNLYAILKSLGWAPPRY